MGDEVKQRPLSAEEEIELETGLRAAAEMAGAALPLSAGQVQTLYDRLRGKADLTEALVVGLVFGELIRPHGFSWVRATDEYGSETCLQLDGFKLCCFPISMIRNRLEDDEAVDIETLALDTVSTIEKLDADEDAG